MNGVWLTAGVAPCWKTAESDESSHAWEGGKANSSDQTAMTQG